jgi:hypothetical protein
VLLAVGIDYPCYLDSNLEDNVDQLSQVCMRKLLLDAVLLVVGNVGLCYQEHILLYNVDHLNLEGNGRR